MSKPDIITQAFALLARYVDDEPCRIDHDGYCQAHSLSEQPCRNAEARRLLDEWKAAVLTPVVEYAQRYRDGSWLVWIEDAWSAEHYPLPLRIEHGQRHGGVVGRRTVIVLKDWKRVPKRRGQG
jgi:hypothetical protein